MNRLREWMSNETRAFWTITAVACLVVALIAYFVGQVWVGKYIAQKQDTEKTLQLPTSAPEARNITLATGPVVRIYERAPTEAEIRDAGAQQLEEVVTTSPDEETPSSGTSEGTVRDEGPYAEGSAESAPSEIRSSKGEMPAGSEEAGSSTFSSGDSGRASRWATTAGSYKDRRNAEQVSESLAEQGIEARVRSVEVGGETYYRVQVGPFDSKSAAQSASEKVRAAGYPSQVVREP